VTPEPAAEQGFKIERQTYTMDGDPVDAAHVKQNTRLVVVLKVTEAQPQFGRIRSPIICRRDLRSTTPPCVSGDTGTLPWITDAGQPVDTEFRDDRFTAAFNRKRDDPAIFTWPMWSAPFRPANTCARNRASRTCIVPTVSAARQQRASKSRRPNERGGQRTARSAQSRTAENSDEATAPASPLARGHAHNGKRSTRRMVLAAGDARLYWRDRRECVVDHRARTAAARPDLAFSTQVVDRHGKLLRAYATGEGRWRLPAKVADVDPRFFDILFAYEDKRFRQHHGVDPLALMRLRSSLSPAGGIRSGGSTLTMQVARLLEPRANRSFLAKLRQSVRAIEIERALSKDQILSLYLELAPYGGNIEGIRAASLAYFGKEPRLLTLGQAALLVALPQAPELRRPDRFPRVAGTARNRVLDRYAAADKVPADEITFAQSRSGACRAPGDAFAGAARS